MKTMLMPCHHLSAARTHVGITTFEPFLVVKRWCKGYQLHIAVKPTIDSDHIEVGEGSVGHSMQYQVVVSPLPPSTKRS